MNTSVYLVPMVEPKVAFAIVKRLLAPSLQLVSLHVLDRTYLDGK